MNRISRMFYAPCLALFLALTYAQAARAQQVGDYRAEAIQFLAGREPQLQAETRPSSRLYMLLNLTPAALYAGDEGKAAAYARELMALGEQLKARPGNGPGMYADAVHVGNMVLGRIALSGGDVGGAREHLLASARVPGSPVLKSFGPNMLLASELIEKGEYDAVVQYLDLCARFWEREGGKLKGWKAVVQERAMPNFGPNLGTQLTSWRFAK